MLGAIIGDIVGSRWEFNPTNDYNFPLFSDKNSFTDDTICTVAVADALLHGSDDYGKYIHMWCRKYPHPMGGYGGRFAKWVASDNPQPYNSFGNGSAMRVSPIGWWFDDGNDIWEQSAKSATCTHNHPEGINGAQAVVWAINGCRELRRMSKGKPFDKEDILWGALDHGVMLYEEFPQNFKVDLEKCANKFDETCQGTVPVALWIVLNSTSFEDAIRKAVSLGADADTLGAITGSIAEALWGIPEWMKEKALSYLPEEMKAVLQEFRRRLQEFRKLSKHCKYFKYDDLCYVDKKDWEAYLVEQHWANDLARSYKNADKAKKMLKDLNAIVDWRGDYAEVYELPLSLIGYIVDHVAHGEISTAVVKERLEEYLNKYYEAKHPKPTPAPQPEMTEEEKKEQFKMMMFWKLGLGHMGKLLNGEDPMPDKTTPPSDEMIKHGQPMPDDDDASDYDLSIPISREDKDILRKGHIPEVQEDHWFMYTDDEYILYYRSWTGMCAFEAHYTPAGSAQANDGDNYVIDHLRMNKNLCEFGVNGDEAGAMLFRYLITAEIGADSHAAWQAYLDAWEMLNEKYKK